MNSFSKDTLRKQGYTEKEITEYYALRNRKTKYTKPKKKPKYLKKYHKYLKESPEWANIKHELYTSRGRKCEVCLSTVKLQIHHKTYKNIFKEEPTDLVILCEKCHMKVHK